MKYLIIIGTGLLCSLSNLLSAQSRTINLQEALSYALENKADAKKSQLEIKKGKYQIQEARAQALPNISANGTLGYNPILQESAMPGEVFGGAPGSTIMIPFGQKWNSTAGVTLQQNLFNQQVFVGLKAAKTTRDFYEINAGLTEEQIIERVSTAYYQVFVQKQKLETIESSYSSTEKVKNIIQSLFDNGLAKRIDLDRINVKLSNLSTNRQQLINAVQLQENGLKFYMGMPIHTAIELEEENINVQQILLSDEIDVSSRTEIKLLEKQKELLQYNKQASKAAYYPSLALSGTYAWQGTGDKFPIGTKESEGTYWTDYANIGLSLSIPIFSGNGIRAKVNQAQIEIESLEQDIQDTSLGLNLEYANAKAQIENSLKNIDSQKENMQLAQNVLNDTQNNYQNGLAGLTELLDAENALVEARNNYSNSLLELKLAEIQLIKSKGELKSLLN